MRASVATIIAVIGATTTAHANSRLPATNQLVIAPDDASSMLLRSTFGMLFTHDSGKTWDWLCEQAIPCSGQQDPAVALLDQGVVISAQEEGLAVSPDDGCSWNFAVGSGHADSGPPQKLVIDVARAPDGMTAIAATNVFVSISDAGTLTYASQMLRTTNSGKDWTPLTGAIDPSLVLDTLDLAPSDPQRIYITGQVFGAKNAMMLVSKDSGQSYLEYPIAFAPSETGAYIAAVDPNDADRVYVRTLATVIDGGSEQTSRLLVSTDGGQTFTAHWSGDKMLGFALSKDGSRVYIGTSADGLLAANASDLVFTQKSKIQVQCLMTAGDTLYACADEGNTLKELGVKFILGATVDEGQTFTPLLTFETVHAPLDCPVTTSAATTCNPLWPALEQQLSIDGGSGDAGGNDSDATPPTSSCGCDSGSSPSPFDALWLGAPLALFFILRSRPSRAAR